MSKTLRRAIKLREWTRVALDRGDFTDVCRLNRIADDAYLNCSPLEQWLYRQWCRENP